jgi:myo-inositol-1(or 4)-monophosphatase
MGSVSLDLAYLASGKYDGVIAFGVGFWDISSGIILIKESGGFVEYEKKDDGTYTMIAGSSKKLLKSISDIISSL